MKKDKKTWLKYLVHVVTGILLSLIAILLVSEFLKLPVALAAPNSDPTQANVLSQLGPRTAVALIFAMVVLVGIVFWLFIFFGRRLQMRGFLGPLVADAIARSEIARREARLLEDLRSGKIAAELTPGSEKFNERYGIPQNEPVPPLTPGIDIDESGHISGSLRPGDGWGNTLPGLRGSLNPFDNGGPGESRKPSGNQDWYQFAHNLVRDIGNWTTERLVTERNACQPDESEADAKVNQKIFISGAIKSEINRRFWIGYQQEQKNNFYKQLAEITNTERTRTRELLPSVDVSSFGGGWAFVLEFTTIIFIVFAVLALGIVGVLTSEPIAAILAAIAGYVLGKSTSVRGAGGEEIRRGGEEPKALFEALTRQEEIKSSRDEERRKLQREIEALQEKLSQSKVTVPDVKGLNPNDAESRMREKHLVVMRKEIENSKAETGKVFDQSPEANAESAKGSSVVLFVATKAHASTARN